MEMKRALNVLAATSVNSEFGRDFLKKFPMEEETPVAEDIYIWARESRWLISMPDCRMFIECIKFAKAYKEKKIDGYCED